MRGVQNFDVTLDKLFIVLNEWSATGVVPFMVHLNSLRHDLEQSYDTLLVRAEKAKFEAQVYGANAKKTVTVMVKFRERFDRAEAEKSLQFDQLARATVELALAEGMVARLIESGIALGRMRNDSADVAFLDLAIEWQAREWRAE